MARSRRMSATTPSRTWARPNTECRFPGPRTRPCAAAQRTVAATSSADAGSRTLRCPVREVPEVVGGRGSGSVVTTDLAIQRWRRRAVPGGRHGATVGDYLPAVLNGLTLEKAPARWLPTAPVGSRIYRVAILWIVPEHRAKEAPWTASAMRRPPALQDLHGWHRHGDSIWRTYQFDDFPSAVQFVGRVADATGPTGHQPDIAIRGGRVTLELNPTVGDRLTADDRRSPRGSSGWSATTGTRSAGRRRGARGPADRRPRAARGAGRPVVSGRRRGRPRAPQVGGQAVELLQMGGGRASSAPVPWGEGDADRAGVLASVWRRPAGRHRPVDQLDGAVVADQQVAGDLPHRRAPPVGMPWTASSSWCWAGVRPAASACWPLQDRNRRRPVRNASRRS